MTNLNYADLESYSSLLNQVKDLTADLEELMSGAYPDNSREPDFRGAERHAEMLSEYAKSLFTEVRAIHRQDSEAKAAEATCNCSNPFCQV